MAVDTAGAVATLRGLTAKFRIGYESAAPFYPTLCYTQQSMGADEQYGFLGAMPGMREWLGDRQFAKLRAGNFTIVNKQFEGSVEIEKKDIDDDRLGMYGPVLENLGAEAAHHPDELLLDLITAGDVTACFDGQYFFDTDHSWGDSGTQSNDLTYAAATDTTPTEAEFRGAYHQARKALLQFKNDQGKLFIRPTVRPFTNLLLVVPPDLEEVANQAINKTLVSNGETNIILDKPSIVTLGGLTNAAEFYLFDLSRPFKPFVFQARQPLATQMKGMDDRETKAVKFMSDARYNMGYFAWWTSVMTTFT